MFRGKNYKESVKLVDKTALYDPMEAFDLVIKASKAKFDETVELHVRLGVDSRHADQQVRGAIVLPHGTGKDVRVVAIAKGDAAKAAEAAGAMLVGEADLVARIQNEGFCDFDVLVTTPDMMGLVGRLGKVLGPRGLMPNAKTGTVTFDVAQAVKELKAGRVDFKVDKAGVLHAPLGKVSFGSEKILDNLRALLSEVNRLKPSAAKGAYMKAMAVSTTMGPGFKIDPTVIRKFIEGNV